jgi:hypothetical protein
MKKQIVRAYLYSDTVLTRGYTANKFLWGCSPNAVNMPHYYKPKEIWNHAGKRHGPVLRTTQYCTRPSIEVLNVKVGVFILLIFATLPECSQNQTAVSDTLRLLSDF